MSDRYGYAAASEYLLTVGADPSVKNDDGWEAQVAKLEAHKRKHGGCNVPQKWARDPGLG